MTEQKNNRSPLIKQRGGTTVKALFRRKRPASASCSPKSTNTNNTNYSNTTSNSSFKKPTAKKGSIMSKALHSFQFERSYRKSRKLKGSPAPPSSSSSHDTMDGNVMYSSASKPQQFMRLPATISALNAVDTTIEHPKSDATNIIFQQMFAEYKANRQAYLYKPKRCILQELYEQKKLKDSQEQYKRNRSKKKKDGRSKTSKQPHDIILSDSPKHSTRQHYKNARKTLDKVPSQVLNSSLSESTCSLSTTSSSMSSVTGPHGGYSSRVDGGGFWQDWVEALMCGVCRPKCFKDVTSTNSYHRYP